MITQANAAILYEPDGYDTSGPRLMGRQSAGAGFLKGFARYAQVDRFYCLASNMVKAKDFAARVNAHRPGVPVTWAPPGHHQLLAEIGCLYLPDPQLTVRSWGRRRLGDRAYSLCGVTHTTASDRCMNELTGLVSSAVQSWDAVICTSKAVHQTVMTLIDMERKHLAERLGAARFTLPQLPIIPLGIHREGFVVGADEREAGRQSLGIAPSDAVIFFLGRLSYHAKANPLPMYLALEAAAKRSKRKIWLVQAGWFGNEEVEKGFKESAQALCPSVKTLYLEGRDPKQKRLGWAVADIFTSLADNIQETFGLTPIEGMASALPVVVSDWSGYKETVRGGVDGFLVPTMAPPAPAGTDLANRYEDGIDSYDRYCGNSSQVVSVDVQACADAYSALIENPDLRKRMGESGRQRVQDHFDWQVIIPAYQALWQELAERRRRATDSVANPGLPPHRPDPFAIFGHYATSNIELDDQVTLTPGMTVETYAKRRKLPIVGYAEGMLLSDKNCREILARLKKSSPLSVRELLQQTRERRLVVMRGLVWLAKIDVVKIRKGSAAGAAAPAAAAE